LSTVILFDIDGTLVLTGGAGGRAMSLAFDEIFAIPDAFNGIPLPGRTDAWILADAVAAHGIPPGSPDLARFRDVYLRHLARELERPAPGKRKGTMPGVPALLDALAQRDDAYLALLTGNYEDAARLKLEYFDLWRIGACGGPSVPASRVVVIGDTPLDVACAAAGGARSIAVATGSHSVGELIASGADVVLEDLSDTPRVLTYCGLRISDCGID